jgi:hypothetical protein
MPGSVHPKRLTRSPRAGLLALATLVSGVLVAGCGASSTSPPAATVGGATTSAASAGPATTSGSNTATGAGAGSSGSTPPLGYGAGPLGFAKCMHANGVPTFADSKTGGVGRIPVGNDLAAPAFNAAQAKCDKLVPGSGPPGLGPPPSAETMAKLLKVAQCMRQLGVPHFLDPLASMPSNLTPGGFGGLTDYEGAILVFPRRINMQSPAFTQAAAVRGGAYLSHRQ